MDGGIACRVRRLGRIEYAAALQRMQAFTQMRVADTIDEIWLLEHLPVYTLGLRARHRSVANFDIPVVATDRGGDVTYHGPGQPIVYVLLDLERRRLGIHELVRALEASVIELLHDVGIEGIRKPGAPGVYVGERKIAALGLRIRTGRSYHGIALNVSMDLAPFDTIDPCGYPGLRVTQISEWRPDVDAAEAGERLLGQVLARLGYTDVSVAGPSPAESSNTHHVRR